MQNTDKKETYKIPLENLGRFKEQMKKLAKKAKKLNSVPVGFEILDPYFNSDEVLKGYEIKITGDIPKYEGWEFVASIEHTPVGNIVKAASPQEEGVLKDYRTTDSVCDHCQHQRNRKQTYLVRSEEGMKQVGSTCLKDYLGHKSPQWIAMINEFLDTIRESGEDGWGAGAGECPIPTDYFLLQVAKAYRKFGWLSKSAAGDRIPTATWALNFIFPPKDHRGNLLIEIPETKPEDKAYAKELLEYCKSLAERENLNDFLHNLKIVSSKEAIEFKDMGILAAAVVAYNREKEMELTRTKKKASWADRCKKSSHFGETKTRYDLKLKVVNKRNIQYRGGFAESFDIVEMEDSEGHLFVWLTSKNTENILEKDEIYKVKVTVKAHTEYKGLKQTKIQRVTVLEGPCEGA